MSNKYSVPPLSTLYHVAFNALLQANRHGFNQVLADNPDVLRDWRFWRDYGTLRIDAGQRTGKSTWINWVATENDLILHAGNVDAKGCLADTAQSIAHLVARDKTQSRTRGRVPRTQRIYHRVFVECASWLDDPIDQYWYTGLKPYLGTSSVIVLVG
jgi:hypothetical protein